MLETPVTLPLRLHHHPQITHPPHHQVHLPPHLHPILRRMEVVVQLHAAQLKDLHLHQVPVLTPLCSRELARPTLDLRLQAQAQSRQLHHQVARSNDSWLAGVAQARDLRQPRNQVPRHRHLH